MKKIVKLLFFSFYLSFVIGHWSLVRAAYVLPYPSYMPGNKLYRISMFVDTLKKYWSWGTIAQTKYQLSLSDKYLVEAKTLFEYHQYLLAVSSLKRSGTAFNTLPGLIISARQEKKDVVNIARTISDAATEHGRVLNLMKQTLPDSFTWIPEKDKSTELSIRELIEHEITIRESVAQTVQVF
jgi:hypothetical protein